MLGKRTSEALNTRWADIRRKFWKDHNYDKEAVKWAVAQGIPTTNDEVKRMARMHLFLINRLITNRHWTMLEAKLYIKNLRHEKVLEINERASKHIDLGNIYYERGIII